MQYVDFFGHKVSKIVLGDNSMTGHSYITYQTPGTEMIDFYTAEKIKETLFHAESLGINTMLPLAHPYMARVLLEYIKAGGKMQFIWQPYLLSIDSMWPITSRDINKLIDHTIGIYHQGTNTDLFYETDRIPKIKENIEMMKELGVPVGLGTHCPPVIELAEEENWGAEFYLGCMHNGRKGREGEPSGFLSGKEKDALTFYACDRPIMLNTLKKITDKPVGAFKIFGGGQMLTHATPEEKEKIIYDVYDEVFTELKPNDFAIMGVFQRDEDQLATNVRIFNEWAANQK